MILILLFFFFFQAEDGIRDLTVTGVQTCALPISRGPSWRARPRRALRAARPPPAPAPPARTPQSQHARASGDPTRKPTPQARPSNFRAPHRPLGKIPSSGPVDAKGRHAMADTITPMGG